MRWGECIIAGVCTFCSRFNQTASVLLQLFSSAAEKIYEHDRTLSIYRRFPTATHHITIAHPQAVSFCWQWLAWTSYSWWWTLDCWSHWWQTWCRHRRHIAVSSCMRWVAASSLLAVGPSETSWIAPDTCDCRGVGMTTGAIRTFSEFLIRLTAHTYTRLMAQTYTVLLSCRISLLENSLRTSKKARLRGGPPSPWGLGSLKANSMPSLKQIQQEKKHENHESKGISVRMSCVQSCKPGHILV